MIRVLESDHEIIKVGHRDGNFKVDIASADSIEKLFNDIGSFYAVISTAGLASVLAARSRAPLYEPFRTLPEIPTIVVTLTPPAVG